MKLKRTTFLWVTLPCIWGLCLLLGASAPVLAQADQDPPTTRPASDDTTGGKATPGESGSPGNSPSVSNAQTPLDPATIQRQPLSRWLELLRSTSGKTVSFPMAYGRERDTQINIIGDLRRLDYSTVKAVLRSNGYDITEELRSDLIQVRHSRQRIRSKISRRKAPPTVDPFGEQEELVTWLCRLQYLEVESTYDTLRQILRVRARHDGAKRDSLEVEMVPSASLVVMTGDFATIDRMQEVMALVDIAPLGKLPIFQCFTMHHISVEELTLRVRKLLGFSYAILNPGNDGDASDYERVADKQGHYARLLAIPRVSKIIVDTNNQDYLELLSHLIQLLDRRNELLRANTFVYRASRVQVATLEDNLRQFIWSGGIPEEEETAPDQQFPTRIVSHDRTNTLIIQAPARKFRYMLDFLESVDRPQADAQPGTSSDESDSTP